MEALRGSIGLGLLVTVAGIAGLWLAGPGPNDEPQPDRDGQIHIASVENNHTERVILFVQTVTGDLTIVDGNGSLLSPDAWRSLGSLDCRDEGLVADRLRIAARVDNESGETVEEYVELEEGDCAVDGGAEFEIAFTPEEELSVRRNQ